MPQTRELHMWRAQGLGWKARRLSHLDATAMNGDALLWNTFPAPSFPQNLALNQSLLL